MANTSLSIDDLASVYGISADTLLLYEAEGIIAPLRVGSKRYYSSKDRIKIEIVLKGRRLGFSLKEVKTLIMAYLPSPHDLTQTQIEARIAQLREDQAALQVAIDDLLARGKPDT